MHLSSSLGAPPESPASRPLRILILEDMPTDAELLERELKKVGMQFVSQRVDTRAAFVEAIETFKPDVLLCDYNLRGFTGREALDHVRRLHPEIPVVIVTGALGDQQAVELLQAGARDYVLKSTLARLPTAVERAISVENGIRRRKEAEQALRESESKFRGLVEQQVAGIVFIGADTTIGYVNPYFAELNGYAPGEAIGVSVLKFVPEQLRSHVAEQLTNLLSGAVDSVQFEGAKLTKAGHFEPLLSQWTRCLYEGKVGAVGVLVDISERKKAEQRLAISEERFRMAVEEAPDAIVVYEPEQNRFIMANKSAERLFGCGRDEILKHGPTHFYAPTQPDKQPVAASLAEHNRRVAAGESLHFERNVINAAGDERLCEVTLVPLASTGGRLTRTSLVDVTERRRTERALQRATHALVTLSEANRALVRATSRETLLQEMCRIVVEVGGYPMAWIGLTENGSRKTVRMIAHAGKGVEILGKIALTWGEEALGQGMVGTAIKTGRPQIGRNPIPDPRTAPWRAEPAEFGYASSAVFPLREHSRIIGMIAIYAAEPEAFGHDEQQLLGELASDISYGITAIETRVERDFAIRQHERSMAETIAALADTLEIRDAYTAGHHRRVTKIAEAIAKELALDVERARGLRLACGIHDLGKIGISTDILSKPGKLTALEFEMIKTHPRVGYEVLKDIKFPWPIADIILQHHERTDGSGYPNGLKGDAILLEAKILAVADVVEAIMSHRPYRPSLGLKAALDEIRQGSGKVYDTTVVEACLKAFESGDPLTLP